MNLFEREGSLVGFRPEHLLPEELVAERDGRVPVKLHVERVEYLGSDRFAYGTVPELSGERRVVSRLPFTVTTPVEEDAVARFAVAESNLRFFDKQSGARTAPQPLRGVGA
jgi:multiple sugar transport system ATP-binding protein